MSVEVRSAAVDGIVPPTTLALVPGETRVIAVETDERPKTLSLLIGGRVRATSGEVLIDGRPEPAALRERVALVDTPFASEPSPTVGVATVASEELAFAGLPAGRRAVDAALAECGLAGRGRTRVEQLETGERLLLLCTLAARRPGVDALVITSPERHGGDPTGWFPPLERFAASGLAVLIVTDATTGRALESLGAIPASLQRVEEAAERPSRNPPTPQEDAE